MDKIIYSSDGSNSDPRGNGPAGCAFCINGANPHYFYLEIGTNNLAEMRGFVEAVLHADRNTTAEDQIEFHTDSQWTAYIVAGHLNLDYMPHYGLSAANRLRFSNLLDKVKAAWDKNRMTLKWVPRGENKAADIAANIARQRALEKYK